MLYRLMYNTTVPTFISTRMRPQGESTDKKGSSTVKAKKKKKASKKYVSSSDSDSISEIAAEVILQQWLNRGNE